MGGIPKWVQVVVLLAIIAVTGVMVYKTVTRNPLKERMRVKEKWESEQAFTNTKELREKGRQQAGPSNYTVEATYVSSNDYKNAIIRKTAPDGKVVEEVKAPQMTVTKANDAEFFVAVFDATRTTYDEAGKPETESMPGRKDLILYVFRVSPPD
jgi:hypothetical protein